jgi:ketosteroid isomerase-like protein
MNSSSALPSAMRRKLLIGAAAVTATTASFPMLAGASGAKAEVKKAIDGFFDAARRRDWDAAGKLLSNDFRIWFGSDGSLDRAAYVALLKEDDLNVVDMSLHDLEIGISADGSLAWGCYRATVDAISKGQRSVARTAETIVFERGNGENWLMRHIHVSLSSAG